MIKVVLYVSFLSSAARQQCASPATVSSHSSFLHAFLHFCLAICPLKEVALVIGIRLLTPKIKTFWIWHGVGHPPTRGFVPTTERKVAWFRLLKKPIFQHKYSQSIFPTKIKLSNQLSPFSHIKSQYFQSKSQNIFPTKTKLSKQLNPFFSQQRQPVCTCMHIWQETIQRFKLF